MERGKRSLTYLDTHVLLWLYDKKIERFSTQAKELINHSQLRISPIVTLELEYLIEIGRVAGEVAIILDFFIQNLELQICGTPFANVTRAAQREKFTRDPFDRLIVAQARLNEAALITADEKMIDNYQGSII